MFSSGPTGLILTKTLGTKKSVSAAVSSPVISGSGEVIASAKVEQSGAVRVCIISTATGEEVTTDKV